MELICKGNHFAFFTNRNDWFMQKTRIQPFTLSIKTRILTLLLSGKDGGSFISQKVLSFGNSYAQDLSSGVVAC